VLSTEHNRKIKLLSDKYYQTDWKEEWAIDNWRCVDQRTLCLMHWSTAIIWNQRHFSKIFWWYLALRTTGSPDGRSEARIIWSLREKRRMVSLSNNAKLAFSL
jgi:hypothetical protein